MKSRRPFVPLIKRDPLDWMRRKYGAPKIDAWKSETVGNVLLVWNPRTKHYVYFELKGVPKTTPPKTAVAP